MSNMQYIREHYGVPCRRGAPVKEKRLVNPRKGVVTSVTAGGRVLVRFGNSRRPLIFHPSDLLWIER